MNREAKSKAHVLEDICSKLSKDRISEASMLLQDKYPFVAPHNAGRRVTRVEALRIFERDGFRDCYTGLPLVFPGTLRLISLDLPKEFPYHAHGKTDECHFAFWELFPTLDHRVPVSRGGADDETNWVTTSTYKNAAKANFTLEELGWDLSPAFPSQDWDGLIGWFKNEIRRRPHLLQNAYVSNWFRALRTVEASKKLSLAEGTSCLQD